MRRPEVSQADRKCPQIGAVIMRKFLLIILIILFAESAAFALLNQEVTQLAILEAGQNEVKTLQKMIEHQEKMLKKLEDGTFSSVKTKHDELIKNFEESYKILKLSNSITHMVDDFENKFKERHPDYKKGLKISELKNRIDTRDTKWRYTMKAYIQDVNWLVRDYKIDDANRAKLMDLVKSPAGQTQALQGMHAMLDHASVMAMRAESSLQGFMTVCLEREYDRIDVESDKTAGIAESYNGVKKHKPSVTARKLGL